MRHALGITVSTTALTLGCSGPLAGDWRGDLACGGADLRVELTLEGEGATQAGAGTRTEVITDSERGTDVDVVEHFDVTFVLRDGLAAQTLDTELTCTSVDRVAWKVGRVDPTTTTAVDCEGEPFDGYEVAWDGADVLTWSGPDACVGDVERVGR